MKLPKYLVMDWTLRTARAIHFSETGLGYFIVIRLRGWTRYTARTRDYSILFSKISKLPERPTHPAIQ